MTDRAKRLVAALREHAEWAHANEFGSPITLGDDLEAAANMIERLSEDLESNERLNGREVFEISSKAIAKLEADRDAWKRRREAAEHDINAMLRAHVDAMHCDQCAKGSNRELCRCYGKDMCHDAEWRGPCAENGGVG